MLPVSSASDVSTSGIKIIDGVSAGTGIPPVSSEAPDLCNDMWLCVFSYLSFDNIIQIQTVCSRWRGLAQCSWNHISSLSLQTRHTKGLLGTLAEKLRRLRSINLMHYRFAQDELIQVFELQRSLQSLNVSNHVWNTGRSFAQAPPSLTEVLARCCERLTDGNLCVLFERCPNLETIDVSRCYLNGQFMTALAKNCQKLKRLIFSGSLYMTLQTSHFLELSNLPLLEVLQVDYHDTVTDDVFYHLGRSCPLLKSITCASCHHLTDAAMLHLSPCQQLEHIDFSSCRLITDKGLLQLGSAHTGLKRVMMTGCNTITSKGVGDLGSACPDIQELHVSSCTGVTVSENIEEEKMWWTLKSFKSLLVVDVSSTDIGGPECFTQAPQSLTVLEAHDCSRLTDINICVMSERCPNLENIDISDCIQLTERSITALAKNCRKLKSLSFNSYLSTAEDSVQAGHFLELSNLPLLEVLHLDLHYTVTDDVLYHLGRSCPRLRSVSFKHCHQLTDAAIANFSPCQKLKYIDLSLCNITDEGLLQLGLAHTDSELASVSVSGCRRITSKGVSDLCLACPEIQTLDIRGCPQVSDDVLPVLQYVLCSKRNQRIKPMTIFLDGTSVTPEIARLRLEDGIRSEIHSGF